ncbi:PilZ domain-containing protein [Rhizobium laguerreae]|uniref:PilZ domain-containing protein n=1 Tax=Rhizobium laguerreae TaxID=1076926 RepID=UPI001C926FA8|nr:PilZ domain-containing protein [Rhizobium laguerreae]MBY3151335.1 PilZ domain-containing protein [Rhizobium laguerreae]MBY3433531.1 PilZ domain-containing protein [Rhizobium laguerreae]
MSAEQRSLRRNRALKVAQIVHAPNGMYYDCRIVDLTSVGARVKFDKVAILGDEVELLIKPEGVKVLGRIAWKSDGEFGVEFHKELNWLKKHDIPQKAADR